MTKVAQPELPDPQIHIEVRRMVDGQWLVARRHLALRDWLNSFAPSGMSDRLIHECLGDIGWRP
jgi:hypothetical protein